MCVEEIDKSQGDERPVRSGQDGLREGREVKPAGAEAEVKPISARLDQVTSELLAARISRGKAQSLAAQVIENGHGPGYIGLVLDYISQQRDVKKSTRLSSPPHRDELAAAHHPYSCRPGCRRDSFGPHQLTTPSTRHIATD